jgi:CRP-like cAMP-binding protein
MDMEVRTGYPLLASLTTHLPDDAPLTASESAFLLALQSSAHAIRRGHEIIAQGRNYNGVFVLLEGFGLRYKVLTDGRRQVFHVALPGDLVGFPACFFERALYSVTALTKVSACLVSFADMAELFRSFPRLAIALFRAGAGETAMYGEHLAGVGRRGAYDRVAHFVLEMATRLRAIGIGDGIEFSMPLTQEQIADVVGLSAPHVNRMLRRLREEGLIDMDGMQIKLRDREALAALADFDDSYLIRREQTASIAGAIA